jgi:hypothetical protein
VLARLAARDHEEHVRRGSAPLGHARRRLLDDAKDDVVVDLPACACRAAPCTR